MAIVSRVIRTSWLLVFFCICLSAALSEVHADQYSGKQRSPHSLEVEVKILAINDFHGQLESPGTFRAVPDDSLPRIPVGGIDWLAGYIHAIKREHPNTTVVSAGDLIGATPLISALFHDEGTIETMNRAGLEINAVGNHEFDEGKNELLRMQSGGCHPTDPNTCQGARVGTPVPFEGAKFQFLAANVIENDTGNTLFPGYVIREYEGVKVGFIGLTLKETPSIVTPSGVAGLTFADEASTINQLVRKLKRQRVRAIVVLIHQGGVTPAIQSAATINGCEGNLEGSPIRSIVSRLSKDVDLVISGHTHRAYNCLLPTRNPKHRIPVVSANSQGRVLSVIDLKLDRFSGRVKSITPVNIVVDRNNTSITPDADIRDIVDAYREIARPVANRVIGSITQTLSRSANAAGESILGRIIADAQLAATQAPELGGAQIAFMNPGGIRANLEFASSDAGEGDGKVTYGEAFTVQPFGNSLVTMTLTGAQIKILLEQQFTGCPNHQPFNRILQVSRNFSYTWNREGLDCDRIDPASMMLGGEKIDPSAAYRVTVNSFLADGGDLFTVLTEGVDRLGGALDLDALEAYIARNTPVAADETARIHVIP